MDLAVGARHLYVAMDLFNRAGDCKLVKSCSYPLTAAGCVTRVYTDLGVFEPGPDGFTIIELDESIGIDELRDRSGLDFH